MLECLNQTKRVSHAGAWISLFYAKSLIDEATKFPLALLENSKISFVEEACVPVRGLSEGVFQLPSCYVQQYVSEGVGLCSRQNLHGTDNMKINKPRIVDLRSEA